MAPITCCSTFSPETDRYHRYYNSPSHINPHRLHAWNNNTTFKRKNRPGLTPIKMWKYDLHHVWLLNLSMKSIWVYCIWFINSLISIMITTNHDHNVYGNFHDFIIVMICRLKWPQLCLFNDDRHLYLENSSIRSLVRNCYFLSQLCK